MKRTQGRAKKGILFLSIVFSLILAMSFSAAGGPQKAKKEGAMGKDEIGAVLSCMGYGYKVKVLVNGNDIGIKGGMSESKRLFEKNSAMASEAPPDMRKKLFVLEKGQNTISVEYKKEGTNEHDKVEITIEAENYPGPVFKMETKKPSGKVEKTITIQSKAPADFKTVTAD